MAQTNPPLISAKDVHITLLTLVNTHLFLTLTSRSQVNFWRIVSVQTPWTITLGIVYSLLFMSILSSFSNVLLALKGEDTSTPPPLVTAYTMFMVSLILYMIAEVVSSVLSSQNLF